MHTLLRVKEEPNLQMGNDRMIPRHVSNRAFTVTFPDRSEWKDGFQPDRKEGLIWYADGSMTNKGTGGRMQKFSFSLLSYYETVLYMTVKWLKYIESFLAPHIVEPQKIRTLLSSSAWRDLTANRINQPAAWSHYK
jgi:hypothetical protein